MSWARNVRKFVTVIGSANERSGSAPGCARAPMIMRNSEFLDGIPLSIHWERIVEESKAKNISKLENLIDYSKKIAKRTNKAISQNKELLVLGGDHAAAIGIWSGVASALLYRGQIGLVWIDAHLDAHTIKTSKTGNLHGTPVAHLLGHGDPNLYNIYGFYPKIPPQNFVVVGARSFDEEELDLIHKLKVRVFDMNSIIKNGCKDVLDEAISIANHGTVGYGMSIDLDAFDPKHCPAVSTPVEGGIDPAEFLHAIRKSNLERLICTEIAEFFPPNDSARKKTEKFLAQLIQNIYLTKFKDPEME